ncbi:MAG: hypothetical protein HXN37_02845 [Prevotella histicola]|nr:hypothetical protein [Prevotella histicola]
MDLRSQLTKRICKEEVKHLASMAESSFDDREFSEFFQLLYDEDARVSENIAWIMSHFNKVGWGRLDSKKQSLMEEAMHTSSTTELRLLLTIISKLPVSEEEITIPFIDFCLDNIANMAQSVAVKSLCIYLSFQQCKFFPELLHELEMILTSYDGVPLSPGLKSARSKVLQTIAKHNKRNK